MNRLEYIETKLEDLTPEFKESTIIDKDGTSYTFENYLKEVVMPLMNDDFTFDLDSKGYIHTVEKLIELQQVATKLNPFVEMELPMMKKDSLVSEIEQFASSDEVKPYLEEYVDYDPVLITTLEDVINDHIIPNVDAYGYINHGSTKTHYKDLIRHQISRILLKREDDLIHLKAGKKEYYLDAYKASLNFPVDNLDKSLTVLSVFINNTIDSMGTDAKVSYKGAKIDIDAIIAKKANEAQLLQNRYDAEVSRIRTQELDMNNYDDFVRIGSVLTADTPSDNIIFELLETIIKNISANLSDKDRETLIKNLESLDIKNKEVKELGIAYLNGMEYKSRKDDINIDSMNFEKVKEEIDKQIAIFDATEQFTVESAKKTYEDFNYLVNLFMSLAQSLGAEDEYRSYIIMCEQYVSKTESRYHYEDEKREIFDIFDRRINDLENGASLDELYFQLKRIADRVEELKDEFEMHVEISDIDSIEFNRIMNTVQDIKSSLNRINQAELGSLEAVI